MTKPVILLCLVLLSVSHAFGQTYLMNGSPISDCSGTFYDSGGGAGNYANNQSLTTTICSDGTAGTHIQLNFSGVDLAAGDELCFYDGPNPAAPLLSCSGDYQPGAPFIVQATAVNPGGCLTVTFNSDASGTATGWAAVISCVASCQTVLADLVSTTPAAAPADTGWIDICPGERVFFNGTGIYPQNGFAYQQSDLTTIFEWNFGDGDISYGPGTSHRYDEPGGYYVQLFLTDAQGCRSTNLVSQRVRVSPRPNFQLTGVPGAICAGDTLQLSAGFDTSATDKTLQVLPQESAFAVEGSRSDSLALPDGTGIPYETTIFFTEFSPGQVLTDPNDLESICVNMEHSWARDIEISLTCPNGQSIILHNFGGQTGSQVFLGIPNDNDLFNPIPGTGYDYCWIPNAPNPTWLNYANAQLPFGGTLPAGDYTPFEPFSDLIGCPLNGEWTITVTDLWPIDNGFIFSWGVKFDDALYPNIETFTPQFLSWGWDNHPSIFYNSTDSIAASPQNGGTAGYVFTVNDEFGCAWETLITVPVLPPTHPNCHTCSGDYPALRDTAVCLGQPVALNVASLNQDTFEVRFEAYPDYAIGNGNHPHSNPYASPIAVNSLGYNTLITPLTQVASVCMDIETDFDADLNIYLRAPDGKQLELSTGNGAAGDNYKITCFTPSATTPIVGSAAPFNGTYKPEGNWANLNNAQVNGDWKLLVSDGFGINQYGKVKWWSIGFNYFNTQTYTWTNTATLSCGNCPNPVANPVSDATYTVTVKDKFNCQHTDTVTILASTTFPAPTGLNVISMSGSAMTWGWNAVPGAVGYEINVNNSGWVLANGNLSHTINGLVSGDIVLVQVRSIGGGPNCPPDVASAGAPFFVCNLSATLDNSLPALCPGTSTGSATISVNNANPPVQYLANGQLPALTTGNLSQIFPPGNNFVIVRDSVGCRDTVFFSIAEPAPITVTTVAVDATCNGDPDGSVSASASGGAGNFTFAWQACGGGGIINNALASGLFAGCYRVTATDANGCTAVQTDTVGEPAAFTFQTSFTPVSCNGGADGTATIEVSGGTAPYGYLWDNGDVTQTADNLDAGFHYVTITDGASCQVATFALLPEPSVLVVDSTSSKNASCFGGSNGTASVFAAGGTPPYAYLWNDPAAQVTQKALNLEPGNYMVTVTDSKNCSVVAGVSVGAPTQLLVGFSSVTAEKCAGACDGTATVLASGGTSPYDYLWDAPALPDGSPAVTGLCPSTYTVTVQDALGCTAIGKATIDAAIPIDILIDAIAPACANFQDGSIFVNAAGGQQPYSILWSNGATGNSISNLPCGEYTMTLTDNAGCEKIDTIVLPCPEAIVIDSIVPQAVKCFGDDNGGVRVYAHGGTGTLNYIWSDPAAQAGPQAVNLIAGNYTVTITDSNGCVANASAQVLQPEALTLTVSKTDVQCFGGSNGSATANPAGGTQPYTYAWNYPQTGQTITGIPANNYIVTVIDANACTAVASATVAQPATPVSILVDQTRMACFEESNGEAIAAASGGNGPTFSYAWSNGQTGSNATSLPVGTVSVTVSDNRGCTSVQSVTIDQYAKLSVALAFVSPTCYNLADGQMAINLLSGGVGMGDTSKYIFQWSVPGAPNINYLSGLAGGVNYSVTVTDLEGCSGTASIFMTQPLAIMPTIASRNVTCNGAADGMAEVIDIEGANLPVNYTWSSGTQGSKAENLAPGPYTLNIVDAKGCTATDTVIISEPDSLTVVFDVKELLCSYDSNAVIAAVVQGGTPEYTLQWSNNATGGEIDNLAPGTYAVTITDQNGCTLTDSTTIARPDSLQIQVEATDPVCFGGSDGRIRLLVSGGQPPLRYSIDDGPFGGSSIFLGLAAGSHVFKVKDGKGCISGVTGTLGQPPKIEVSIDLDTTVIVLGDSLLLSAEAVNAFGISNYDWRSFLLEPLVCVDTPECSMIWIKPYQTNTYVVKVKDENGCRGEGQVTVEVEKPRGVYVPTGFTPNGDLNNDLLVVFGKSLQIKNVVTFNIYDRWGELVYQDQNFQVNDDTRGWDGVFRGKNCDPGVYVWYVEVEYRDGFREALKGNVTLIR
jgi:gliding motility-associated-like protein